jgi:hypothetical protein
VATQPEDLGQEAEEQVETTEVEAPEQEAETPAETTEEPDETPDPVANLAKSMGWRPKEEFKGDPNLWKPAEEYIRAGGEIQRGQSRELKDLRATMDNIARTNAAIVQSTINAEREKLVARYQRAVEDGDPEQAYKLGTEINNLNGQAQRLVNPAPPPPPPEATDWVQRNQWFTQDPLARDLALNVAERYAQAGKGVDDQLQAAEREVRRQYPHLFGGSSKPPAGVQQPSSRSGSARKMGSTYADLPAEAKKIAADMAERGVIPDKEAYAKQYWQNAGKRA